MPGCSTAVGITRCTTPGPGSASAPACSRAWRGEHGNWCPGYERHARPASDLTVDHVVPLEVWEYAFIGTGTVGVVEPGEFYVTRSEVVT